ncbi:MAG: PEP-utilizing enzyme, partial [Actinomycetota bacterium]
AKTLAQPPQHDIVSDWTERRRPRLAELNTALQRVDLDGLDDAAFDDYLGDLLDHAMAGAVLHFWLHGHDLAPLAQFMQLCERWDLDTSRAVDALTGASPSTSRPLERLTRLRTILDEAGVEPTTLDDVRAVSPQAARLLDQHLDEHGHVLATGYDITAATLIELPQVILDSIRTAAPPVVHDHDAVLDELAAGLDAAQRDELVEVVEVARSVMDMRDDNGPLTIEWPAGLIRRALLAAGDRLVERGRWPRRELALEVTPNEARRLLRSNGAPGAATLTERAEQRKRWARLDPPVQLGPTEPEPSPDVLPQPLPDVVRMVQASLRHLGMDGQRRSTGLEGIGVGSGTFTGCARVVTSAEEAIDALVPGDVLVVRATSPAFNVVLSIAGAVVTSDGGVMSHAAVLARELGIAAVVGARDALSIPDGATVTVDADRGVVTIDSESAA